MNFRFVLLLLLFIVCAGRPLSQSDTPAPEKTLAQPLPLLETRKQKEDRLYWQSLIAQRLVPPLTKSDRRVRVTSKLHIDESRVIGIRLTPSKIVKGYVVQIEILVKNISHAPLQTGDYTLKLKTSSGKILGVEDMAQSGVGYVITVAPKSDTGTGALFRIPFTERITALMYDDAKSRFRWSVESRPLQKPGRAIRRR